MLINMWGGLFIHFQTDIWDNEGNWGVYIPVLAIFTANMNEDDDEPMDRGVAHFQTKNQILDLPNPRKFTEF